MDRPGVDVSEQQERLDGPDEARPATVMDQGEPRLQPRPAIAMEDLPHIRAAWWPGLKLRATTAASDSSVIVAGSGGAERHGCSSVGGAGFGDNSCHCFEAEAEAELRPRA